MQIAVVFLREDGKSNSSPDGSELQPRFFVLGRCLVLTVLSILLLCALALVVLNFSPAFRFGAPAVSTPKASGGQFIHAIPVRVLARPFDRSRPLKAGDLVVVDGMHAPSLQKVAAAPNGTVLLRRGNSLRALYLVGEDGYVVVSQKGSTTVRSDEIRATLAASSTLAASTMQ